MSEKNIRIVSHQAKLYKESDGIESIIPFLKMIVSKAQFCIAETYEANTLAIERNLDSIENKIQIIRDKMRS